MKLCEIGHPPVVYDDWRKPCPVCDAINRIVALRLELDAAHDDIDTLTATLRQLEAE